VIVLLRDGEGLDGARARLRSALEAAGLEVELHSWQELSAFYNRVRGLFNMIFAFIFSIVLVIVLMSIINTMTMSVVERTREIGTLRALGMNGGRVITLFAVEGVLLVLAGALAGLAVTVGVASAVNGAGLSYVPPNNSDAVQLLVDFVPSVLMQSFVVMALVAAIAALMPARRAARMRVVDALAHV
jgi:putative ABC transport system permease protein